MDKTKDKLLPSPYCAFERGRALCALYRTVEVARKGNGFYSKDRQRQFLGA